MRVAVYFEKVTSNARYRAIFPCQELARRGHTVMWPGHPSFNAVGSGGKPPWDLLHVQQAIDESNLPLIARLRAQGIAVVWDSDDDILSAPRGTSSYQKLGGRRRIKKHFANTVEIARAAHLMTTTNEHLARIYRDAGVQHVAAIENYLDPKEVNGARRRHQGIVIGIVAAGEHRHDINKLGIAKALKAVLAKHDGVRVVAIGEDLELGDHRYIHLRSVPPERLLDYEREFDIGLAPLIDMPFNHSRSKVKLKEYAAGGAMWLASPVGPYRDMTEQQGGLLVGKDEWEDAISMLIADEARRRELTERARAWVKTQTARQSGDQWEAAFRDAVLRAKREA